MVALVRKPRRGAVSPVIAIALTACGTSAPAPTPTPTPSATVPRIVQVSRAAGDPNLDDVVIAEIAARPEVSAVMPRLPLVFPAMGTATWQGEAMTFEVGGFMDGIDPAFAAGDPTIAARFQDWDAIALQRPPCTDACTDRDDSSCDPIDHTCHRRVPAIVSPMLLSLYNDRFAPEHGLTRVDDVAPLVAAGATRFKIVLGDTMVRGPTTPQLPHHEVEAVVVGVSTKATALGLTVPIGYVRRWNQELAGGTRAQPRALVVTLRDERQLDAFSQWARARGFEVGLP